MLAALIVLAGCSSTKEAQPRPQLMVPQTRLIYHGGAFGVFTFCDRGNRVYLTETGLFTVVKDGCPTGEP